MRQLYCKFVYSIIQLMSWKIVALLVALTLLFTPTKSILYSALRMCDSEICDIDLAYKNSVYNMTITLAYLNINPTMSFCLRQRDTKNGTNGTCFLQGFDKNYQCLLVNYVSKNLNLRLYTADSTLNYINGTQIAANSQNYSSNTSLSLASIALNTLPINKIFEAVVGNSKNLATDSSKKLVFFHTFRNSSISTYLLDGIFMQRYVQCYQYYVGSSYNFNLIFYGGVVRGGQDTMFIHFLSFLTKDLVTIDNTTKLNIWGALGFSKSHAARDMIGFSSGYGYTYDLYSLYASAPFNDTSLNVNGTDDFIQTFSSNEYQIMPTFIAVGGYRSYDTKDIKGDEIIRKKIDYNFCYAVAYSTSQTVPIQPTDKIKHDFVNCWNPNITVWERFLLSKSMLLLLMIMLILK